MKDYKELIDKIRGAAARWEEEHPIVGVGQMRYCDALRDAADAIEQLANERDAAIKFYVFGERNGPKLEEMCKEREELTAKVARLEAENRAKEQYIAETIGKVIKERDESPCDLCRFNPPSCLDGKPCTICPAVRRQSE